jgi:hypothetical protein
VATRIIGCRDWRLSLIILATVGALSCGGGKTSSTLPNSPAGKLTMNTSALNFGSVSVGSSRSSTITLRNSSPAGSLSVTVTQVSIAGAGFTVNTPAVPFALAAGQSSSLTATFAPLSAGTLNGQLSVDIQGVSQTGIVTLSGVGRAAGQLGANPSSINFGSVAVGSSQNQTGSLTAGGADIIITSASWNGQGYSLSGITFPATVTARNSIPFTVTFTPQDSVSASGQVSFVSNASDSPTTVTMTGTGTQTVQHSVSLSWNASTSPEVGYNIYRSAQSAGSYAKLNSSPLITLGYTDSSVQSGSTYFYAVTAVDSNNVESAYSNIATAVIP